VKAIERKFLLRTPAVEFAGALRVEIHQGYLAYEPGARQVRLRRSAEEYSLTVKLRDGMVREEVTIALSAADFAALWPLTEGRRIHKTRCHIPLDELTVEIDVFHGLHEGLVIAEVDFPDEASCRAFVPPEWFGEEVTENPAYKNTVLALALRSGSEASL
jgi:CYTH domain-containing protein